MAGLPTLGERPSMEDTNGDNSFSYSQVLRRMDPNTILSQLVSAVNLHVDPSQLQAQDEQWLSNTCGSQQASQFPATSSQMFHGPANDQSELDPSQDSGQTQPERAAQRCRWREVRDLASWVFSLEGALREEDPSTGPEADATDGESWGERRRKKAIAAVNRCLEGLPFLDRETGDDCSDDDGDDSGEDSSKHPTTERMDVPPSSPSLSRQEWLRRGRKRGVLRNWTADGGGRGRGSATEEEREERLMHERLTKEMPSTVILTTTREDLEILPFEYCQHNNDYEPNFVVDDIELQSWDGDTPDIHQPSDSLLRPADTQRGEYPTVSSSEGIQAIQAAESGEGRHRVSSDPPTIGREAVSDKHEPVGPQKYVARREEHVVESAKCSMKPGHPSLISEGRELRAEMGRARGQSHHGTSEPSSITDSSDVVENLVRGARRASSEEPETRPAGEADPPQSRMAADAKNGTVEVCPHLQLKHDAASEASSSSYSDSDSLEMPDQSVYTLIQCSIDGSTQEDITSHDEGRCSADALPSPSGGLEAGQEKGSEETLDGPAETNDPSMDSVEDTALESLSYTSCGEGCMVEERGDEPGDDSPPWGCDSVDDHQMEALGRNGRDDGRKVASWEVAKDGLPHQGTSGEATNPGRDGSRSTKRKLVLEDDDVNEGNVSVEKRTRISSESSSSGYDFPILFAPLDAPQAQTEDKLLSSDPKSQLAEGLSPSEKIHREQTYEGSVMPQNEVIFVADSQYDEGSQTSERITVVRNIQDELRTSGWLTKQDFIDRGVRKKENDPEGDLLISKEISSCSVAEYVSQSENCLLTQILQPKDNHCLTDELRKEQPQSLVSSGQSNVSSDHVKLDSTPVLFSSEGSVKECAEAFPCFQGQSPREQDHNRSVPKGEPPVLDQDVVQCISGSQGGCHDVSNDHGAASDPVDRRDSLDPDEQVILSTEESQDKRNDAEDSFTEIRHIPSLSASHNNPEDGVEDSLPMTVPTSQESILPLPPEGFTALQTLEQEPPVLDQDVVQCVSGSQGHCHDVSNDYSAADEPMDTGDSLDPNKQVIVISTEESQDKRNDAEDSFTEIRNIPSLSASHNNPEDGEDDLLPMTVPSLQESVLPLPSEGFTAPQTLEREPQVCDQDVVKCVSGSQGGCHDVSNDSSAADDSMDTGDSLDPDEQVIIVSTEESQDERNDAEDSFTEIRNIPSLSASHNNPEDGVDNSLPMTVPSSQESILPPPFEGFSALQTLDSQSEETHLKDSSPCASEASVPARSSSKATSGTSQSHNTVAAATVDVCRENEPTRPCGAGAAAIASRSNHMPKIYMGSMQISRQFYKKQPWEIGKGQKTSAKKALRHNGKIGSGKVRTDRRGKSSGSSPRPACTRTPEISPEDDFAPPVGVGSAARPTNDTEESSAGSIPDVVTRDKRRSTPVKVSMAIGAPPRGVSAKVNPPKQLDVGRCDGSRESRRSRLTITPSPSALGEKKRREDAVTGSWESSGSSLEDALIDWCARYLIGENSHI